VKEIIYQTIYLFCKSFIGEGMEKTNKISGAYDVILLLPFLLPELNFYVMDVLAKFHQQFNLPGVFPRFEYAHLVFVSIMALVSIMWGILRFIRPSLDNLKADTWARYSIAGILLISVLFLGVSGLFALFIVTELGFGTAQLLVIQRNKVSVKSLQQNIVEKAGRSGSNGM
jgi:hypothetical protein